MHILYQKMPILSKIQCSNVIFFQIFHEKPPAAVSISGQTKKSILSKLHHIMGKKS